MRSSLILTALCGLVISTGAFGARRALLIGISEYAPGIAELEGPRNDALSLQRVLTQKWNFAPEDVRVLINKDATRAGILGALDTLVNQVRDGDVVFIFFSGHGTSWYAPGRRVPELDPSTGGIVGSDGQMIFGRSDLQPRLRRLDSLARAFVAFDSCYSGSAIKSITFGTPKFTEAAVADTKTAPALSFDERRRQTFGSLTTTESIYPYKNVIFLSAASKAEVANDIPSELIRKGLYSTVDRQAHGAMTDMLLAGMMGEADANHDHQITYQELYQFVRQRVSDRWNQTPQLLYNLDNSKALALSVFDSTSPASPSVEASPPVTTAKTRVVVERADGLRKRIAQLPGIVISSGAYDLLVRSNSDGWELFHASGSLIRNFHADEEELLLKRIAAEPLLRRLLDRSRTQQDFNLVLSVAPEGRGFYSVGDQFNISMTPEKVSYLLLINVDISGVVTVLYPRSPSQAEEPAKAERRLTLGESFQVTPPTGTEFLLAMGFRERPALLDRMVGRGGEVVQFDSTDSRFERLLELVEPDLKGRAFVWMKMVTSEKKP